MSGFVACHAGGAPLDAGLLEGMMAGIAHRGGDGRGLWRADTVGLGFCFRRTAPGMAPAAQPFVDARRGLTAVLDGRLDNREELWAALGDSRPLAGVGDAELAALAYDRWDAGCPARVLGDFAFVIWDAPRQRLFGARDPFGAKPFYYYWDGRRLVGASAVRALWAAGWVPRDINEGMIADDLLSDFRFDYRDPEATYFAGIKQLRPAHTLRLERGTLTTACYWEPGSAANGAPHTDEDYFERFRELFLDAVRCRMRDADPLAVALSGGIDSSLVAGAAETLRQQDRRLPPLQAFTVLSGGVYQEEWDAIRRLQAWHGTPVEQLPAPSEPTALFEVFRCDSETPHHYGFCNTVPFYRAVAAKGCRVLLTGYAADELIETSERGLLEDLLFRGRVGALAREIRRKAWSGRDPSLSVAGDLLNDQMPAEMRLRLRTWRGLQVPDWVDRDFAARTAMRRRRPARQPRRFPTRSQEHSYRALTAPEIAQTLNQADDVAAQFGIEWRYPYLDRRLVEHFLSVPLETRRRAGYRKGFAQRALQPVMRGVIRDRVGADTFDPPQAAAPDRALEAERFYECLGPLHSPVFRFVDAARIQQLPAAYAGGKINVRSAIWKLAGLAHWMRTWFPETAGGRS
jgi:asparagine synthase (glutamine-hydrolysing)